MHRLSATLIVLFVSFASAHAQEAKPAAPPTEAKRNILDRHDQSGVDGKEIVIGTAELPAGSAIGWHVHPGDESGYVLRGTLTFKVRGQPDREMKAGDHFFNPRGTVHGVSSAQGATVVSTWIVDKGKPMAEPVK
jgi:quercetin dioxygenase-like cupin family protein